MVHKHAIPVHRLVVMRMVVMTVMVLMMMIDDDCLDGPPACNQGWHKVVNVYD